jgi:NAD(P)-dependent dehydrogenase (short-subunit alcohol dehydrogenase family)
MRYNYPICLLGIGLTALACGRDDGTASDETIQGLKIDGAGARGVVIADLDEEKTRDTAESIGATPVQADVTKDDDVAQVIATAEETHGPVDLFCANAGIGRGTGLDSPDETWDAVLRVNTLAHVVAARQMVPRWLERGGGYWLTTASAAGIVTQIGDAPYSVSKHAAVAFAEWLSVTYGSRGLKVSCLCPMGVDTPLLREGLSGGEEGLGARVVEAAGTILQPEQVADVVVEGLAAESFLILPHPEVLEYFRRKAGDYDRWLAGMQRLQDRVAAA